MLEAPLEKITARLNSILPPPLHYSDSPEHPRENMGIIVKTAAICMDCVNDREGHCADPYCGYTGETCKGSTMLGSQGRNRLIQKAGSETSKHGDGVVILVIIYVDLFTGPWF